MNPLYNQLFNPQYANQAYLQQLHWQQHDAEQRQERTFYSHLFMKRATIYNYQQQIIAAGRSTHSTMVFQQGFWIGAEIR